MVLVYIPQGEFWAGSNDEWSSARRDRELGRYSLDAFWIDQTEVTNEKYSHCVDDGACRRPAKVSSRTRDYYYGNPSYDDYPVIYVIDPSAYCVWAGRRLPTSLEWEKAARGTEGDPFPWGSESVDCTYGNFLNCEEDTMPVGLFLDGASPYGVLDMAGNVFEWTSDLFAKGGAFDSFNYVSPSANRSPEIYADNLGLRCAADFNASTLP